MAELQQLLDRLDGLLESQTPAARRQLAGTMARDLRASQANRIKANLQPDGSQMQPRKPQPIRKPGKTIRRKLFQRLIRAKWMKKKADGQGATIEFVANASRIARVHQLGLRDKVRPGGPDVTYPARELLGFTSEDLDHIEDLILASLSR